MPPARKTVLREEDPWLTKLKIEGLEAAGSVRARQGMVIRLYDDMMVVERREFGEGGSLGADWVMPFGKYDPHPFSLEEQKKAIGEPQFRKGAKLEVFLDRIENTTNHNLVNPVSPVQEDSASLCLCVKIPLADGRPDSRVYVYEVVVAGDGQKLHKVVYAAGCNMGIGHEPNGGVTELLIPKSDLPVWQYADLFSLSDHFPRHTRRTPGGEMGINSLTGRRYGVWRLAA